VASNLTGVFENLFCVLMAYIGIVTILVVVPNLYMGNEAFLLYSYFLTGLISCCLGVVAYSWLRRPMGRIADAQPRKHWGSILKKSFPNEPADRTISLGLLWQ